MYDSWYYAYCHARLLIPVKLNFKTSLIYKVQEKFWAEAAELFLYYHNC